VSVRVLIVDDSATRRGVNAAVLRIRGVMRARPVGPRGELGCRNCGAPLAPEGDAPTYGVLTPVDAGSLPAVQLSPWISLWRDLRRARRWRDRLRYLFDAPGWSHDGPDRRVRVARASLLGAPRPPDDHAQGPAG
jgi:hypothetical protein